MTNEQMYIAIGAPMFFNAALIGILAACIKAKFDEIDKRFDNMRYLSRPELRRVEEVTTRG